MHGLTAAALFGVLVVGDVAPPAPPQPSTSAVEHARQVARDGDQGAAAILLREYLLAQPTADDASEARLLLAQTLLDLGRTGPAFNELTRLKAKDPEYFRGAGGPALLAKAGRSLGTLSGELEEREVAQVFVIPRLRGGPRQLWQAFRRAGVDVVVIRAFHLRGDRTHEEAPTTLSEGAYFPSKHVPLVADRLHSDCEAVHALGMKCYAWMTTRKTPVSDLDGSHRDVAWSVKEGKPGPGRGLDLFDPAVVHELEDVWREIAKTGVDGALFQDDLMLGQLEGFSKAARENYRQRTGKDLDPARLYAQPADAPERVDYLPEFWEFAAWKRDRILDVAGRLQAAAREVNPQFEVALNLYYETALKSKMGLAWFSQDLQAAAARDFRWLAVMAYQRQIGSELSHDAAAVDTDLAAMADTLAAVPGDPKRILVKIQSRDWESLKPIPPEELARAAAPFRRFALCLAPADDGEAVERAFAAMRPAVGEPAAAGSKR